LNTVEILCPEVNLRPPHNTKTISIFRAVDSKGGQSMSWRAQNRSEDAKTPSAGRGMSEKPELGCCPVQPYSSAQPWRDFCAHSSALPNPCACSCFWFVCFVSAGGFKWQIMSVETTSESEAQNRRAAAPHLLRSLASSVVGSPGSPGGEACQPGSWLLAGS
jgi:hypothetical protein